MTYFETRDFYLAAFLLVKGCNLLRHYKKEGSTQFVFDNKPTLQETIADFYFNQGNNVNAQSYGNGIRALKSLIHQARTDSNSISTSYSEDLNNGFYHKFTGTK